MMTVLTVVVTENVRHLHQTVSLLPLAVTIRAFDGVPLHGQSHVSFHQGPINIWEESDRCPLWCFISNWSIMSKLTFVGLQYF